MRLWLDKAVLIVVLGGIFYGGFYFLRNLWFEDKPKKQKIISACMSVFVAAIILISFLDVFEPDINDGSKQIAEEVLEVTDMFLNNEISVIPAMQICEAYINSYYFTDLYHFSDKSKESRRQTEEEVYAALHWIYNDLFYTYFDEVAIINEESLVIGEKTRDNEGNIIENPYSSPGYELWCSANESCYVSELESHRNYLAKLLNLPYESEKINFDYSKDYLFLNEIKELYYE